MEELHKLLKRQRKKHLGADEIPENLKSFIHAINEAYKQNDIDRLMIERSLDISSKELIGTIDALKKTQMDLVQSKEQVKQIAYHDALTGLPNRYMLNNVMHELLAQPNEQIYNSAVMFIDLDNFKKINDSFGHRYGDFALLQVAKRLANCVRKKDKVFRYGGDEFLIIFNNASQSEIKVIAQRIIDEFYSPFILNQHEVYTTPSIGVSFYPTDGNNIEVLINNADAAMYRAKEKGKNGFECFSKEIDDELRRKIKLENGLRKAIQNEEFILYYQPQIELDTGKLWGLEALIRWQHPTLGMISPLEFIPIAEETGLIVPIGKWVLKNACEQNKLWQEEGLINVPIAVNVSAVQLKNSDFIETVRLHLNKAKLDPKNLVIEFTESIMQDTSKSFDIVNDLKKLGVKVAIDDFGTGYSSLSLLKNLNIDILKIDSNFIKDIEDNPKTLSVIKLIIDIGNKLNFSSIVEGIENEHQAQILKQDGCKYGQGYLISKPLPVKKLKEYLKMSR